MLLLTPNGEEVGARGFHLVIQLLQGGGAFARWLVSAKMRASAPCPLALVGIPNDI